MPEESPENRIRAILCGAGDEPMPSVRLEPLRKHHAYRAGSLAFPFAGRPNSSGHTGTRGRHCRWPG